MPEGQPVLSAENRSYRYGDGLFETMKLINGRIILEDYHFERLEAAMHLLHFNKPALFNKEKIREEIMSLCRKNNCSERARVRLSVSRGNGGLYDCDDSLIYIIESWPLNTQTDELNDPDSYRDGLIIDIYPDARKSCDVFSNLKSANYLTYVMAALYAKENKLNDCLVLNVHDRICDATIANVFWVKEEIIYTPPLSEGCVAGVMRRYLLEKFEKSNFTTKEKTLEIDDLLDADEIFLSNAVYGIRWVGRLRDRSYHYELSKKIFKELIEEFR